MNDIEVKIIELYEQIYQIRKECGLQRQSNHLTDFQVLDDNLRNYIKQKHPYELTFLQKKSLEEQVQSYRQGGSGLPAKLDSEGYLYRIANQIDIFANTQIVNFSKEKIPVESAKLWNKLNHISKAGKDWLPLSDYGHKPYKTNNQISWWTHHQLDDSNDNLIEKANRLGLFENWIANEIYLLRCKAHICANSSIASVPTIIDAYASSVFYTTEDSKNPVEGTTINLSQAPHLELGLSEIVLKEIDLNYIEIKPIRIESEHRQSRTHIASKNLKMLECLKSYYENMP
jgi:hypothetical protein